MPSFRAFRPISNGGWGGLSAAGLTVLVWAVSYSRWVIEDKTVPWDAKNQFYAFFRFLAQSLHEGTSVFWNPYHYGGHPSIADPQSLVFAPLFLAWAYFDPAPTMAEFDFVVYAHLLVGGLAMVAMGARRGWPVAACVLAATVFMLGGAAAGRLNHSGIIVSYGLFPLAVLALEVALERRSLFMALVFALVASFIALGRNQVAMMLCLVLVAIAVLKITGATSPLDYLRRRWHIYIAMLLAGVAINLVPLLLTLQFAALSNRPAVSLSAALEASLHPSVLLSAIVPNVFGSHNMGFNYWGPHYTIMPEVAATDDSFNYLYFGVAPVALLLWFGMAGRRLASNGARTWAVILVVALLFSFGRYGPIFPLVFETVPGFSFFRRPIDGMFVVGAALAFLAGHLLADYVRNGRPAVGRGVSLLVAVAGASIVVAAYRVSAMSHKEWAAAIEFSKMLPVLAIVVGALIAARGVGQRQVAAAVVVVVAAAELVVWNSAARFNAEPAAIYSALETMTPDQQAAVDVLNEELAVRHRQGARPRVEIVNMGGPWQNLAMVRAIEATNGYNPLRIGLYDRMVSPGEMPAQGRTFTTTFSGFDCALARALGVEYLVSGQPIEQLGQKSKPRSLELLHAGQGIWIYRFERALPRAIFHARIEVADADALGFDGKLRHPPDAEHAVIDDETPVRRRYWITPVSNFEGGARIRAWRPGRVEVDIHAPSAGVLVLHDTYYPGWVATVDGMPASILRADTLFRGVEVPPGYHRVAFEFQPLRLGNLLDAARSLVGGH